LCRAMRTLIEFGLDRGFGMIMIKIDFVVFKIYFTRKCFRAFSTLVWPFRAIEKSNCDNHLLVRMI